MDVSVVIVNHGAGEYLEKTLASLPEAAAGLSYEVILVDNGDEPQPPAAEVRFFTMPNRGFGAGCNLGAREATGELLLFLNPDCCLRPGALKAAADCLTQNENAGLVGLRTVLPDGSFEPGCLRGSPTPGRALCYYLRLDKLFPNSRTCGGYHMTWLDRSKTCEPEAVSGSFLLLRRSLFEELGGFDEDYFMYGEDLDLCLRVRQSGHRVLYCAEGSALHYHGRCGTNPRQTAAFYDSMLLYYNKHLAADYSRLTGALVAAGVNILRRRALRRAEKR